MKDKADIWVAIGLSVTGGVISLAHVPSGAVGMILVFFGMVMAPGYILSRVFISRPLDPWEIYPISFVLGAACFGMIGMAMFFTRAPLTAAYPAMFSITVVFAVWLFAMKKDANLWERGWSKEPGGLGWLFAFITLAATAVAWRLGSERGWAIDWDYYTYITFVRRIVTRGYADNFPLSYANEGHDPIHSYNVWALMWAVISKNASIDPIMLYIKSAVVITPAALLAFYSLTRALFNRAAGMAATICYTLYHFIALGFVLTGRTSFYTDDPSWLIIFPVAMRFGWEYINAEKNELGLMVAAVLTSCMAMMVHPLWGVLTAAGVVFEVVIRIVAGGSETDPKTKWLIRAGWAALIAPAIWAIYKVASDYSVYGGQNPESWWGFIFFLGLPLGLWMPRIVELIKKQSAAVYRGAKIVSATAIGLMPFAILRLIESRGARAEIFEALSPYKVFLTDSLFILNPGKFSYTAPDMTFFPWIILCVGTLPWLAIRYKKQRDHASLLVSLGMVLIPLIAFHPYLSWIFSGILHVAYLKRALRFSTMFAAVGIGAGLWAIARRSGKWAGVVVTAIGLAAAIAASLYPVTPVEFRGLLAKSWFIMTKRPVEGLFWNSDREAHLQPNTQWDTEEFSSLLENIPLQETVLTDAFTSYRLTAYRDLYVMARLKPSTGAPNQPARQKDSLDFTTARYNVALICDLLRRYKSRWVIINIDQGYQMDGYNLWYRPTLELILNSRDDFEPVAEKDQWILLRAKGSCSPWPPEEETGAIK